MECARVDLIFNKLPTSLMRDLCTTWTIVPSQEPLLHLAPKWFRLRLVRRWRKLNALSNSKLSQLGQIVVQLWQALLSTMSIDRLRNCKSRLSKKRCRSSSWEYWARLAKAWQLLKKTLSRPCSRLVAPKLTVKITRRILSIKHSTQAQSRFDLVRIRC